MSKRRVLKLFELEVCCQGSAYTYHASRNLHLQTILVLAENEQQARELADRADKVNSPVPGPEYLKLPPTLWLNPVFTSCLEVDREEPRVLLTR
jgi:hypothetical protein